MGSLADVSSKSTAEENVVTVFVSGFGPFMDEFPVNPGFEIIKLLPDFLASPASHKPSIRIIAYGSPIKVAYGEAKSLLPRLHDAYKGTVDLVLHIGMASGRRYYTVERFGHRDGYGKHKDVDGKTPPPGEGKVSFGDCPEIMTTSLDYESVLLNWQVNILNIPKGHSGSYADVRPSEDAGHFLCDYSYFNSLAYFGRRSGNMEGGAASDRPVLFLHVPGESDKRTLANGRAATLALIRAMADSYAERRKSEVAQA